VIAAPAGLKRSSTSLPDPADHPLFRMESASGEPRWGFL